MNRHYLRFLLIRLQSAIERVDPELARSVVEEPPLNPDEPFLFEYIDRLVAALSKKMDVPHVERDPALRFVTQIIGYLQGIRAVAAETWDMR
jgi:hypothetical protein